MAFSFLREIGIYSFEDLEKYLMDDDLNSKKMIEQWRALGRQFQNLKTIFSLFKTSLKPEAKHFMDDLHLHADNAAFDIMYEHLDELDLLASELLKRKIMSRDEVYELLHWNNNDVNTVPVQPAPIFVSHRLG